VREGPPRVRGGLSYARQFSFGLKRNVQPIQKIRRLLQVTAAPIACMPTMIQGVDGLTCDFEHFG
jgi:hypothetical protein